MSIEEPTTEELVGKGAAKVTMGAVHLILHQQKKAREQTDQSARSTKKKK